MANHIWGRKQRAVSGKALYHSYISEHKEGLRHKIETRNREEIPFSSQIVPGVVQLQKDHYSQSSTTPHIYIATRLTSHGNPAETRTSKLMLGIKPGIVTNRPRQITFIRAGPLSTESIFINHLKLNINQKPPPSKQLHCFLICNT